MTLRASQACVAVAAIVFFCGPFSCGPVPGGSAAAQTQPAGADTLPIPPVPPRIAEDATYDRCLDMLASDPSGAEALAATLQQTGNKDAGRHCAALAQVELGNPADGAALLDQLASASTAPASFRAVVFGQADQAWTMAARPDQAFASATQAVKLSPDDPDLLIGRAIAAVALQKFDQAADDLTHALDLDPKRADALVLRATCRRNLADLDRAEADIRAAFALDAENPDVLLERGIIRQRRGDLDGARGDWERVIDLAPDTPTADLAQQNLALLDAGPKQ